jgi:hypothetical protein
MKKAPQAGAFFVSGAVTGLVLPVILNLNKPIVSDTLAR